MVNLKFKANLRYMEETLFEFRVEAHRVISHFGRGVSSVNSDSLMWWFETNLGYMRLSKKKKPQGLVLGEWKYPQRSPWLQPHSAF